MAHNPLPEGFGIKLVAKQMCDRRRLDYVFVSPKGNIRLSRQQGVILSVLLVNYGNPVSRADVFNDLWGDDAEGGPLEGEKVIEVQLCQIRRELRAIGIDFDKKSVQECGGSKMRLWNLRECEPMGTAPQTRRLAWPERKARSAAAVSRKAEECGHVRPAPMDARQARVVDRKLMQAQQQFRRHAAKPLPDLWSKPARVEAWEARKDERV